MIPALIMGGASILGGLLGASNSNKAAKQAAGAQDRATASNERIAMEQMARAERYISPYASGGVPAMNALAGRVLPGAAPSYAPKAGMTADPSRQTGQKTGMVVDNFLAQGQGGEFDGTAYASDPNNNDLMAYFNGGGGRPGETLEQFGDRHWEEFGQTEGRKSYMSEPQQAPQGQPAGTYGLPQGFEDRPNPANYAPRPTSQFEFNEAQPDQAAFFHRDQFKQDPGYQFAMDQMTRGVSANKFAGGLGLSGSRAMALQDRAGGLADQQYQSWRNHQNSLYQTALGQYNNNRAFARSSYDIDASRSDARYDTDRGFATDRYDTDRNFEVGRFDRQTGDIFGMAGIGQSGAAALTGAGSQMSNSLMQGNQQRADTAGNLAGVKANNTNAFLGNALQTVGMFAGGFGGGAGGGYKPNPVISNYSAPFGASKSPWGLF